MISYSCNKCRQPLQAAKGCAICDPIRPFLTVAISEDVSLTEVSKAAVRALQEQLEGYKAALTDPSPKARLEPIRANVRAAASCLAKLLDTSRKIQDDGIKAIELMSTREQMDLFKHFYTTLPPAVRSRFLADLQLAEENMGIEKAGWADLAEAMNGPSN